MRRLARVKEMESTWVVRSLSLFMYLVLSYSPYEPGETSFSSDRNHMQGQRLSDGPLTCSSKYKIS